MEAITSEPLAVQLRRRAFALLLKSRLQVNAALYRRRAMKPDERIVTQIPMRELWTDRGPLTVARGQSLGPADVAAVLQTHKITTELRFAVADVGHPLRWLDPVEFVAFWKTDARGRVVGAEATAIRLEDFPGEQCYVVSEWREVNSEAPILLFERHH